MQKNMITLSTNYMKDKVTLTKFEESNPHCQVRNQQNSPRIKSKIARELQDTTKIKLSHEEDRIAQPILE